MNTKNKSQKSQKSQTDLGNSDSKSDEFRSRKYMITINNYNKSQESKVYEICKIPQTKDWVWAKEVGEQGTPHIHLWIEFAHQKKRTTIKKFIGGEFNCQGAKGTLEQAVNYLKKDGIWDTSCTKLKYTGPQIELYDWEIDLVKRLDEEPDDRTITWVWEKQGNRGKTVFQKWYFMNKKKCITLSGTADNMKNGIIQYMKESEDWPRVIFINLPRSKCEGSKIFISYAGLEEIKDMYFFSGKYEGGMVCGPSPHVVVFANEEPDTSKMSLDRWKIINLGEDNEITSYDDYLNISN